MVGDNFSLLCHWTSKLHNETFICFSEYWKFIHVDKEYEDLVVNFANFGDHNSIELIGSLPMSTSLIPKGPDNSFWQYRNFAQVRVIGDF